MPNIPYPNVPALPGVPALSRSNNAQFVAAGLTIIGEILPLGLFGQKWGIIAAGSSSGASSQGGFLQTLQGLFNKGSTLKGTTLLTPDSFVDFEYREEQKIPIYPLQNGAFQSYNKVGMPFDIRLTVTCSGNGKMSKGDFIQGIDKLLTGLTLVDIVTPDATYKNCNLIHVDYRRDATNGATLLIAQLWFQWVRIVSNPTTQTANPSGTPTSSFGQLSPTSVPSGNFGSLNANSRGATGLNPAIQ